MKARRHIVRCKRTVAPDSTFFKKEGEGDTFFGGPQKDADFFAPPKQQAQSQDYAVNINQKSGTSLPKNVQREFEGKMGYDFSKVKIHTNAEAARSAQVYNANAYALGNNIVFNEGQYNPATNTGKRLLAHELTHVAQQNPSVISRDISSQLPKDVVPDPLTGEASFLVNKIDFVVEEDQHLAQDVDEITWRNNKVVPGDTGASTNVSIHTNVAFETTGANVSSVKVDYKVYVKTFYGKSARKSGDSEYGRGTTEQDKKDKHTSLQFHESKHGQDYQDYIAANPLPVFDIKLPATDKEYKKAKKNFDKAIQDYQDAMKAYTETQTDEVGEKKSDVEKKQKEAAAAKK